jgi:DNA-binding NarL/FixJ family response regulator
MDNVIPMSSRRFQTDSDGQSSSNDDLFRENKESSTASECVKSTANSAVRCLIVNHNPAFLCAFHQLVSVYFPQWDITLAHTVFEAFGYIMHAKDRRFEVVLLNLDFSEPARVEVLRYLSQIALCEPVDGIVLSSVDATTTVLRGDSGRARVIGKAVKPGDLIGTSQPSTVDGIMIFAAEPSAGASPPTRKINLTSRQRRVLELVLAGYSNKRIASELALTYGTVKNYLSDLMRIFTVNSRFELAMKYKQKSDFSPDIAP